jgi:hypothetical protein
MSRLIIDNTLLAIAFFAALLITRFTKERKTSAISSFLLLFAPLVVFLNMWAHTVAVAIVNIQRYLAGHFVYSFSLYSLLLFGVVFIVVSGINIDCARKFIKGDQRQKSSILWLNLFTALLFLPMMVFNPIALLPVLTSIVSSVTLWLMKPMASTLIYEKRKQHVNEKNPVEASM